MALKRPAVVPAEGLLTGALLKHACVLQLSAYGRHLTSTSNSLGAFPEDGLVIRINPRILLLHHEHRSDRRRTD